MIVIHITKMFVYQTTPNKMQRILQYDSSANFKIIFNIERTILNDDYKIEERQQIVINTTVNKARVVSKKINDGYKKDPSIDQYVFDVEEPVKQMNDFIFILQGIVECKINENQVPEDKRNVYYQILTILDNDILPNSNNIIRCEYLFNFMFDGIISYLKQITFDAVDGNSDHLKLSGTGTDQRFPLSNLLLFEYKDANSIYTNRKHHLTIDDAWIEYDFGKRKINMKSYSIRTSYYLKDCFHPKSWKFMGSNDHQNWELIDIKENNDELNGPQRTSRFECTNQNGFFRYIKYIQIENHRRKIQYSRGKQNMEMCQYIIGLSAMEFFGSITTP